MKVLVLPEWAEQFCDALGERHPSIDLVVAKSGRAATTHIKDAEVLFGYPTATQFDSAKSLKWIQTLDAGMEGLFGPVPQVKDSDVVVTNARGAGAPMIGEHAVALMLALARQIPRFINDTREGRWDQDGALQVVEFLGDVHSVLTCHGIYYK